MKNITIIGSGSFGCALAHVFSKNNNVKIWSYTKEEKESINNNHECLYVKDIKLSNNVVCYDSVEESLIDSDIVVLVVPSNSIRNMCIEIKKYYKNQQIVLASKGLENEKLLSEVVQEELNVDPSVIIGPTFAKDVGTDKKSYIELSGNKDLIDILIDDNFIINYNEDKIGLEVAGALKNVITILYSFVETLDYGMNYNSYCFIEGLNEIKKIGISLGAKENTFYSLGTLGDLFGTIKSKQSRNNQAGELLAKGKTLDEIKKEVGTTIEGLDTLKSVINIIEDKKLDCPLITKLYNIIYNNESKESIIE